VPFGAQLNFLLTTLKFARPPLSRGVAPERPMRGIMEHAQGGVNKLETKVQLLELF